MQKTEIRRGIETRIEGAVEAVSNVVEATSLASTMVWMPRYGAITATARRAATRPANRERARGTKKRRRRTALTCSGTVWS
jgi:hypothetical protein